MEEYIIASSINVYDVEGAFSELNTLNWKHSANVAVGNIIYIYVGAPARPFAPKSNGYASAYSGEMLINLVERSETAQSESEVDSYGRDKI